MRNSDRLRLTGRSQETGGQLIRRSRRPKCWRRHQAGGFPANTSSRVGRLLQNERRTGLRRFENT